MDTSPRNDLNRDPQSGALIRLRGLYPSLRAALQKVADVILRQPEMAIYASVNEVAAVAGVSEATVMRFCRTLGFKGFQDFKISLAREMVTPSARLPEELRVGDDPATVVRKIFRANLEALQDTLEILEMDKVEEAVQLLVAARLIMIVGVSGSGPLVQYAGNRFALLGLNAASYSDPYMMVMAASLLSRGDVLLAISHSGNTREVLEAARLAQENGARVISITSNSLSPLARVSDLALVTAAHETRFHKNGTASFLCQISLLDSLFTLIFQTRPDESQANLAKMDKALSKLL